MIVEVVGLPGAGKTTMVAAFGAESRGYVVPTPKQWHMVGEALIGVLWYPGLSVVLMSFWLQYATNNTRYYLFMNAVLLKLAKYVLAKRSHRAVVVEGLVQNLLSFWHRPMSLVEIQRDVQRLPMPDVVLFLDGEGDFYGSSGAHARAALGQSLDEWRKVMEHNLTLLLQVLRQRQVRVCSVSRETGVAELQKIVA